jgi:hypothetical protein
MQHRPTLKATFQRFDATNEPVRLFIRGFAAQINLDSGALVAFDGQPMDALATPNPGQHAIMFPPLFDAYGLPWYYDQVVTVTSVVDGELAAGLLVLFDLDQQQQPQAGPIGRRPIDNSPAQG